MDCYDSIRRTRFVHSTNHVSREFNLVVKSYFKEIQLPPMLCSLLLYPFTLPLQNAAPQEFALQFWDEQKAVNASLVIGILGMLIGTKTSGVGNQILSFPY